MGRKKKVEENPNQGSLMQGVVTPDGAVTVSAVTEPERTHKRIAMSSLHRTLECLGSLKMAERFPEYESSEAAQEGTDAHAVAEKILTKNLIHEVPFGQAFEEERGACRNGEMMLHVHNYCAEVVKLLSSVKVERIAVEKKFDWTENLGGTADVAAIVLTPSGKRVGVIIDLKYGRRHIVEVETPKGKNPQLSGYLAAMNADKEWGPIERGICYIYQPRADHPEGALRACRLDKEELSFWTNRLLQLEKDVIRCFAEDDFAYYPGEHCLFCRGEAVCEARIKKASQDAGMDFLPVESEIKAPEIGLLTDQQLKKLILFRPIADSLFKAAEQLAIDRYMAGNPVQGTKVVRGRQIRQWVKDEQMIAGELKKLGIFEPYERSLIGIGQAEAQIGKGKIEHLTEKSTGPLKLVDQFDKREAVLTDAETIKGEFTPFEES